LNDIDCDDGSIPVISGLPSVKSAIISRGTHADNTVTPVSRDP
jgi:hypothetical protein